MPLKVHFLNVGRGDCTIIEFPSGRVGIVDIDNLRILDPTTKAEMLQEYHESVPYLSGRILGKSESELNEAFLRKAAAQLTDPLEYYNNFIGADKDVFRFLVTHPDMDHMTGLYRLHKQDHKSISNFWHTGEHDFNLADAEWEGSPYDERDWETYKELRRGGEGKPKSLQKFQGDTGHYWTEDGLELWAPTTELETLAVEKGQSNILSMILRISHAGRSIILGGDATADDTWRTIYPKVKMGGIAVLKASHHGRKSGYYQPAVKEMSPWLTVTSVGEKEHDATESYRRYSNYTVSLRKCGDVRITINDDGTWLYSPNVAEHWKPQKS